MENPEDFRSPEGSREESADWLNYKQALDELAEAKNALDAALQSAWADRVPQASKEMSERLQPHLERSRRAEQAFEEARSRWVINVRYLEHPLPKKSDTALSK